MKKPRTMPGINEPGINKAAYEAGWNHFQACGMRTSSMEEEWVRYGQLVPVTEVRSRSMSFRLGDPYKAYMPNHHDFVSWEAGNADAGLAAFQARSG